MFEQVDALDALFVPPGGGLLSGTALSTRALSPNCTLYGVEPEAGNDGQLSLRSDTIVHIATPQTIADGAQTQHLGHYTLGVIQCDADDVLTATDAELMAMRRLCAERMKIYVKPTGCLGAAAALKAKDSLKGTRPGQAWPGWARCSCLRFKARPARPRG